MQELVLGFHDIKLPSADTDITYLPSGENSAAVTSFACPKNVEYCLPS